MALPSEGRCWLLPAVSTLLTISSSPTKLRQKLTDYAKRAMRWSKNSRAFKKSVGLNGVGTKAVNALSGYFKVESVRDGESKVAEFNKGNITKDHKVAKSDAKNGTSMMFVPDDTIFLNFQFRAQYVEKLLWNYCYLR